MAYSNSQLDKTNFGWFDKDATRATLLGFNITMGELRGLRDISLEFKYPITAISGKNGTGKSTILACVACAFHNHPLGFKVSARNRPYYTFSDFFIQTSEEEPLAFLYLGYEILYDNWSKSPTVPSGVGRVWQARRKLLGRWNNYSSRARRNVVFCGIERVVPHGEKSVSKSYRRAFQKRKPAGYEEAVAATVSRVLGRDYQEFYYKEHSRYRLPLVKTKDHLYSGFNMGAGENTLFEIFSIIYACEGSLLLVIDEIELGLHEEAQVRLIRELKQICADRHIQIVCTTHSPRILGCLPPDARIHLERAGGSVRVIPGISPEYASGLLSGVKNAELDIYCEDDVAAAVIAPALRNDARLRVQITPIGSAAAVVRQLAARYKEKGAREACAFLDGDKHLKKTEHVNLFLKLLESAKDRASAAQWVENRLTFLPGDTRPERWLLMRISGDISEPLTSDLGVTAESLQSYLDEALAALDHTELDLLTERLNLPRQAIESRLVRAALRRSKQDVDNLAAFVGGLLP